MVGTHPYYIIYRVLLTSLQQCDTDIDLIVYNIPRSEGEKPEARFSIPRLCRNFDEIRQWTLENGWMG